jgi:hypothetical protein
MWSHRDNGTHTLWVPPLCTTPMDQVRWCHHQISELDLNRLCPQSLILSAQHYLQRPTPVPDHSHPRQALAQYASNTLLKITICLHFVFFVFPLPPPLHASSSLYLYCFFKLTFPIFPRFRFIFSVYLSKQIWSVWKCEMLSWPPFRLIYATYTIVDEQCAVSDPNTYQRPHSALHSPKKSNTFDVPAGAA